MSGKKAEEKGRPSKHDTGDAAGQDELAVLLSGFARTVHEQGDPHTTLEEIVRAAVELVPGCDEASISVVRGRHKVLSRAASSELSRVVDALQEQYQEGPCLDASFDQETVRVPDMAAETRWPRFTQAALAAGAAGMLACQLYVEGDDLGVLNLFSRGASAFDDESEHVALLFAAHAAVAFSAAQQHAKQTRNVATRHLIGQAQGILMERYKVTDNQAFDLLVRASQHRNTKLRDVAARLVHGGEFEGGSQSAS
jgi:transcriptional regulator with GAF, ATPase, and Fis domain